ncbi:MAG: PaaI family thioesterase [Alphaproteobacteria bacterium]|nr:PaaI family thioesterase [Alphaproteobacteria bacterium]
MADIPQGFEKLTRKSPFLEPIGPIYRKEDPPTLILGLRIEERHTNARGFVHGGLISTISDIALGYALQLHDTPPDSGVTVSLTTDLFGTAKIGDWLEVRAVAKRVGGNLAFSSADVTANDQPVAQARAVFKVSRKMGAT